MPLAWTCSSEDLDWEELFELYRAAALGDEAPDDLKAGFSLSKFQCFAYEAGRMVAAGRALEDGRGGAYICGVAVHPDHQGKGIGREVVTRLVDLSRGYRTVYLHAAPGQEAFYRKLGFQRTGTTMTMVQDQIQGIGFDLMEGR